MIADLRQDGPAAAQPTTAHVADTPIPCAETAPQAAASTERPPRDRAYFRRVAELGIQAAEALDYAHGLGVIHRDVKPANLLVDQRGNLWVTDFGLAHMQSDARLTMTGDLVGTLRYMSPEQALAKRVVVDHRTDVYSLGATLYELLTLEPAYRGTDRQELLRQIAFDEPRPPRRINKAIPPELATIVQKAMEKNPADRYATAKELADDLQRFLADEPIRARPAGVGRRLRKWGRRHPAAVAAAAAALTASIMVLSGGFGWVANDRATRHEATETEVNKALDESVEWQRRRRLPEALSAARRAQAALAGGHAGAKLRRSAEARVFDLALLTTLEEAALEFEAGKEDQFDLSHADRRYGEIFHEFHMDLDGWSALEAGRHIRDSSIAVELAALLDNWAIMRRALKRQDEAGWKYLLDVACAADPDGWRTQLRDALARRERESLVRLASCDKGVELSPWTLNAVAKSLMESGAIQPAEDLLRQGQRQHPDDFWINENLGMLLGATTPPRHDEAIPFLMVAVALRPQSPGAHVNLGIALAAKNDLDGAIAECRTAIHLAPKGAIAHNNLGTFLREKGDVNGAITEYHEAIRLKKDFATAHFNLGSALYVRKDLEGAIAGYREAIRLKKRYATAHYGLASALYAKKDVDGAITEYGKGIDIDPKNHSAHYNLGLALYAKKNLDGAIASYRTAIALDPTLAGARHNLGIALHAKGDRDGAIAAFGKAIDLDPRYADAHSGLGAVLCVKGDLDGGIAEFREAIRLKKDFAEAYSNLGNALYDKGDVEGAIAECREAIRLDKDHANAHNHLGNALNAKKDLDGAIAAFRKAIGIDPKHAHAHYNLGNVLHNKNDLDGAIAKFRDAIRLKTDFAEAHFNLGKTLHSKGDMDGAIVEYREAVRLKENLPEAQCNLGHILRDKGQYAEALKHLRRGHELGSKNPRWPYPSAQWLKHCERLVELDDRLPAIMSSKEQPASAIERAEYAQLCQLKRLYSWAARLYWEAMLSNPALTTSPANDLRYNAACAAALAGCGMGEDAGKLTDAKRAGLRKQALDWLRADLDAWGRLLDKGQDKARVAKTLQHWLADADFNGVRGPAALAKLPEAERKDWHALWADVAATLAKAQGKAAAK